ncbi:MAG: HAMP domain-containing protein [Spirochaetales bacterium]|nr:HAMP domain-containing protein [Spirochaetales bacterium]
MTLRRRITLTVLIIFLSVVATLVNLYYVVDGYRMDNRRTDNAYRQFFILKQIESELFELVRNLSLSLLNNDSSFSADPYLNRIRESGEIWNTYVEEEITFLQENGFHDFAETDQDRAELDQFFRLHSDLSKEFLTANIDVYLSVISGEDKNVERITSLIDSGLYRKELEIREIFRSTVKKNDTMLRNGLKIVVIFTIVLVSVYILMFNLIVVRLGKLERCASRYMPGDLPRVPETKVRDEIWSLGHSISSMMERINRDTVRIGYAEKRIGEILSSVDAVGKGDYSVTCPISEEADVFDHLSEGINRMTLEQKEMQHLQARIQMNEKLSGLGLLAAGMAHEINNPIGYIKSNLRTLRRHMEKISRAFEILRAPENASGNEEQIRSLKIDYLLEDMNQILLDNETGINKISGIVDNIRGLSQKSGDAFVSTRIMDLIEETIKILEDKIRYVGSVDLQTAGKGMIRCVPGQISQILLNIILNSCQALESIDRDDRERGEGLITIRVEDRDDSVVCTIADNGPGIDEKHLNHLFDPFFTTKSPGKGTGLGLNVSYNIMESHNGSISADNLPEGGAVFTLVFPAERSFNPDVSQ